jgi:N-acyl homoserine lactone hydrolase
VTCKAFRNRKVVNVLRVHAIQTGTVAVKRRQQHGVGNGRLRLLNTIRDSRWTEPLPIYAWAIEHPEGVIVVDTGETARVSEPGYFPRWHPYFKLACREWVEPEQEIGPQLRTVGIEPSDVRWVVLTHLHTDHAGGLAHFRDSECLVTASELRAASGPVGRLNGYLPHRWPPWFSPEEVEFSRSDERFGPFPQARPLTDAGDVYLVSTPGHSKGHMSVVVVDGDTHLFFAGDTSYTESLMLEGAVDGVAPSVPDARGTLARINEYVHEESVVYLPSHDPGSAARLSAREPAVRQDAVVNA